MPSPNGNRKFSNLSPMIEHMGEKYLLVSRSTIIFSFKWAGNSVSIKWWDDLWLQQGLSGYLKYKFVDFAYQDWRIVSLGNLNKIVNIVCRCFIFRMNNL